MPRGCKESSPPQDLRGQDFPPYLFQLFSIFHPPFPQNNQTHPLHFTSKLLQFCRLTEINLSAMAASMATTSTVPKALLFLSNNPVPLAPRISSSSMKFQPTLKVGRLDLSKRRRIVAMAGPPPAKKEQLSEAVQKSIETAKELCAGDVTSGECAAAWDEVEELSATKSHIREKEKSSDPLEAFCKDNPETDECRTYED